MDSTNTQPLSKNAQKRLAKRQAREAQKPERRAKEKAAKKEKKRKWEERERERLGDQNGDGDADGSGDGESQKVKEGRTGTTIRAGEEGRPAKRRKGGPKGQWNGMTVLVDLGFDEKMTDKEIISLSQQLSHLHSTNRSSAHPFHIVCSSFTKESRLRKRMEGKMDGCFRWRGVDWWEEGVERCWEGKKDEDGEDEGEKVNGYEEEKEKGEVTEKQNEGLPQLHKEVLDEVINASRSTPSFAKIGEAEELTGRQQSQRDDGDVDARLEGSSLPMKQTTCKSKTATAETIDAIPSTFTLPSNPPQLSRTQRLSSSHHLRSTLKFPSPATFHRPREDVIYLTADSPNVIERLERGKVYIVGGVVDRNRYKNLCLTKATEELSIPHAALPISEHLPKLTTRKVLTVNQVFDIMAGWTETAYRDQPRDNEGNEKGDAIKDDERDGERKKAQKGQMGEGDWKEALEKVVPKRKFTALDDGNEKESEGQDPDPDQNQDDDRELEEDD